MQSPAFRPLIRAALVLACALGVAAAASDGTWSDDRAPFPFVWRDVALVHLLGSVPLAILVAIAVVRAMPRAAAAVLGIAALGLAIVPLLPSMRPTVEAAMQSIPYGGAIVRALAAFGLALPAALAWAAALPQSPETQPARRGHALAAAAVGVIVLTLVPAVYVGARCRHDMTRLGEYLGQSRFGEAREIVHALVMIEPNGEWNGRPLVQVREDVDGVVKDLEARVGSRLSPLATPQERFSRGRMRAMLDRTDEALDSLKPLRGPEVDSLRGTIYQTREEWEPALASFRDARKAWESQPPSPARQAELAGATTGIAYSLRKMGRYPEAEAEYRKVLDLAPTAESHFLLAQFYEDAQQAANAREHARKAIAMDPERYTRDGEKLINKLAVFHFGCFGVYSEEWRGSTASLAEPEPAP